MEGTKTGEILAALFEADVLADHADDVRLLLHAIRDGACFCHSLSNLQREKAKSQTNLNEVAVRGHDIGDSEFFHNYHARQVRE